MLETIEEVIENVIDKQIVSVSKKEVKDWMESKDPETLGAVCVFLFKPECVSLVTPQLTKKEICDFLLAYYRLCILNDFKGEWVHDRYEAAREFARFFVWLNSENEVNNADMQIRSKQLLDFLMTNTNVEVVNCVRTVFKVDHDLSGVLPKPKGASGSEVRQGQT